MKLTSTHILIGGAVIGVILLVGSSVFGGKTSSDIKKDAVPLVITDYSGFASCLAQSGAKFYGAFWCPHCKEQKELFGEKAVANLPYIECSTQDKKAQTQVCIEAKIEGYPTWEFANGERVGGAQSLEILAEKTQCTLPL